MIGVGVIGVIGVIGMMKRILGMKNKLIVFKLSKRKIISSRRLKPLKLLISLLKHQIK
jgi:hypothetical protein